MPFRETPMPPSHLRVAAVQMRFSPTIDENLACIDRLARQAARKRADVVLFPECATTGYAFDFGRLKPAEIRAALEELGALAARLATNLLIGTPVFRGRKLYNCLVVFDRQGRITCCYAKNHLTPSDQAHFAPGNAVALFAIDGVPATSVICHERRYPELVRLAVMAGAKILFHPNAGMDALAVSRQKRGGRDGVAARAFENAIYYVFANSVGPQGGGKWSAGDSKIVGPDERVLALADNRREAVIAARLDLGKATGSYAQRGMKRPPFLAPHWKAMVDEVRRQARHAALDFDLPG
ncbi:MAG: carbon-nitrogen hydrolase family protein [Thermoguttaceae bacterium]